jgi:hypothetical protein
MSSIIQFNSRWGYRDSSLCGFFLLPLKTTDYFVSIILWAYFRGKAEHWRGRAKVCSDVKKGYYILSFKLCCHSAWKVDIEFDRIEVASKVAKSSWPKDYTMNTLTYTPYTPYISVYTVHTIAYIRRIYRIYAYIHYWPGCNHVPNNHYREPICLETKFLND